MRGPHDEAAVTALGHHLLAEFTGCDAASLADLQGVTTAMLQAAEASGATIVTHSFHHFSPHGVSGAVIIAGVAITRALRLPGGLRRLTVRRPG